MGAVKAARSAGCFVWSMLCSSHSISTVFLFFILFYFLFPSELPNVSRLSLGRRLVNLLPVAQQANTLTKSGYEPSWELINLILVVGYIYLDCSMGKIDDDK